MVRVKITMTRVGTTVECDGKKGQLERRLQAWTDNKVICFNAPVSIKYTDEDWKKIDSDDYQIVFYAEYESAVFDSYSRNK